MCLAIPACVEEIDADHIAQVDILGVKRSCSLDLVPQAQVGDYVLVHAGFAIEVVDQQAAAETLDIIRQFPELADLDVPGNRVLTPSGALGESGDVSTPHPLAQAHT